mmetsp:Transcript_55908/g.141571  ORF Transcript_55908/g.141571 Transcript_55908/m.141571 type:complete len:543 (-) Transcript_55908:9-1637(-)
MALLALSTLSLIACLAFRARAREEDDKLALLCGFVSIVSFMLLISACWAHGGVRLQASTLTTSFHHMAARTAPISEVETAFRVHCGVEPVRMFCKTLGILALSAMVMVVGVQQREPKYILMAWVPGSLSLILVLIVLLRRNMVWKVALVLAALFCIVAVSTACLAKGPQWGVYTMVIIFFSQLGMRRQTRVHSHSLSLAFFFIVSFSIAAVALAASAYANGMVWESDTMQWCKPGESGCKNFTFPLHGTQPYEFCSMSWPMGKETVSDSCTDTDLSIVDFAEIATITYYMTSNETVQGIVSMYFPGWHLEHYQVYNITENARTSFIHLKRGTTSIIAIRGTSSTVEVLEDLNFWMPVGFVQIASSLGPSLYSTKDILTGFILGQTLSHRATAFADMIDYVNDTTANSSNQTIYITGHSLGGGIATAVGAIFDIPVVAFSAPGLKTTSAIMRPEPNGSRLVRKAINVVPDRDIVPKVDQQTGTILSTICPLKNPLDCHSLATTKCELLASCGDGGGRGTPRGYKHRCSLCQDLGQDLECEEQL